MSADDKPTLTNDDEVRWKQLQTLAWNIGKRPIEELSELEIAFCGAFWRAKAAKSRNTELEAECEALRNDAARLKHLHDDPLRAQAYFWNHKGRKDRNAAIDAAMLPAEQSAKTDDRAKEKP